MKITWQSDAYACNYTQQYSDYFSVFQGCLSKQAVPSAGFPCLLYDEVTLTCTACVPSYNLSSEGTCIANTTCPSRQYYHFGQCLEVSILCGNYDSFTGACLTCANTADYDLVNGTCIHKTVSC
jgi:hypothetical protein